MRRISHPLLASLRDMVLRKVEEDTGKDARYFSAELIAVVEAALREAHRLGSEDLTPAFGFTVPAAAKKPVRKSQK